MTLIYLHVMRKRVLANQEDIKLVTGGKQVISCIYV